MKLNDLDIILGKVEKPAQYVGGEVGSIVKELHDDMVRFAFCFPDLYEIGMSHLGMKILYGLLNERPDVWCERVFVPAPDMEAELAANNIPLFALESLDALSEFDIVGFTLQYELSFTAILHMLALGGIPLLAAERTTLANLVVAGGPAACNPEPIADFIDIFALGEGEEVTLKLVDLYKKAKAENWSKPHFLEKAAEIEGLYVPSLYSVAYNEDGTVKEVLPTLPHLPKRVKKAIIKDIDNVYFPKQFVVPYVGTVHDRAVVELFRGCIRGCRFCQAGFIYRPYREKHQETIAQNALDLCQNTGYDELSLSSLSTSDYGELPELLDNLLSWTDRERVGLTLPSLRVDNFSSELLEKVAKVRKTGLTFAPEAGSQRLRDVINKNVNEAEIMETAKIAFDAGYTTMKLYFMAGLPTETLEDIAAIVETAQKVVELFYSSPGRPKGKSVTVTASVATFVPKPFTPFQFEAQDTAEQLREKHKHMLDSRSSKKVSINYHESQSSLLEATLARGDRRLGKVIYRAYKAGSKLDGWGEHFQMERWTQAMQAEGLDMAFYANRKRDYAEVLPWDHLDYGVTKAFLIAEHQKAVQSATTDHCRDKCSACGANVLIGGRCFAEN